MILCPFIYPDMVSLASVPLHESNATAKHPLPSCSWMVNDSHLLSSFFSHTHPAHLMGTSTSLSLQFSLQWFSPIWKSSFSFCSRACLLLMTCSFPAYLVITSCYVALWFFSQLTVKSLLAIIGKLNLFQPWVAYLPKIGFACKWSVLHVNWIKKWLLKLCLPFIKCQNDYALCLN